MKAGQVPRTPREPMYSDIQSAKKNGVPLSAKALKPIDIAIQSTPPGSNEAPASHREMMDYLCNTLLPGLKFIAVRVSTPDLPPLSDADKKNYSVIWERVSTILKSRRPRLEDAPVLLISRLLAMTKQISPTELHTWSYKQYSGIEKTAP